MQTSSPSINLSGAVACVAASMLMFEIAVTRLFSVLFFYHFSFFAISLVMSGLVMGGIVASRWNAQQLTDEAFRSRLALLSSIFAGCTAAGVIGLVNFAQSDPSQTPTITGVAVNALLFLPGLVAAGAFLALAFARDNRWIGRLYAADLVAAAGGCATAIVALRTLQGPAVLLCAAALAALGAVLIAATGGARRVGAGIIAAIALLLGVNLYQGGSLMQIRTAGATPIFERWNEHSRVQVFERKGWRRLLIDRSADTVMPWVPPLPDGSTPPLDGQVSFGPQYKAYRVGRPVQTVAIIGVGGGRDLLPPLAYGASRIDGYELNGIIVDLLTHDFRDYNSLAARPELKIVHDEARVGITHSGRQYDIIQASLIDTWAATASGGFVLSENSLYTREGWRVFLDHLTPTGILTMSRWHIPDAPAETHRLVALAADALEGAGFPDARQHVILLASARSNDGSVAFGGKEIGAMCTILVSKTPFTPEEVSRIAEETLADGGAVLAAPWIMGTDPMIGRLLGPGTRGEAIASSPFNIAPPTDIKPYFFLQVHPGDLMNLSRSDFGPVTQITFNGVRVMIILGACALLLVLIVCAQTVFSLPGSAASAPQSGAYRWMTLYFLGIGLGYILVQVGLHQRLIIILGHPTFALSVVLFSMLLGTGIGAAFSARLFPSADVRLSAAVILVMLCLLRASFSVFPLVEAIHSSAVRVAIVGAVLAVVGFVLGFAFPLGVRRVAPTGEWATQKMWAINGAASIAASVLAAIIGLAFGSGAVVVAGICAYGLAFLGGMMAMRVQAPGAEPLPAGETGL